jgi:hypothetical protein
LAGRAVLAHLRDSFSSNEEDVSERNGADERQTMHGYLPHHQFTNAKKNKPEIDLAHRFHGRGTLGP